MLRGDEGGGAMTPTLGGHAVVLGAGMAGLLTTEVLAERYDHVTIVDRDELSPTGGHRRGVPQGRHTHALLAAGQQALEDLFPGLTGALIEQGVPAGDVLAGWRWHLGGRRFRQAPVGLTALCLSRPLLERHLRARVLARPNLTLMHRCDIVGVASNDDGARVTDARLLRRDDDGAEQTLAADLVVDATGRGSRVPIWLEGFGYPRPEESESASALRTRPGSTDFPREPSAPITPS
jgi:2-polyprenyl-6-methoxyphenol hydroxylase-like FAD-dependent oxidoreductase